MTAVLVSGIVAYRIAGSRIPPATSVAGLSPDAQSGAPPPSDVTAASRPQALPTLPEAVAGEDAVGASIGASDEGQVSVDHPSPSDAATPDPGATARKRRLLVAAQNEALRREADERVFESRKLPEPAREVIRRINQDFARSTRAYLEGDPDAGSSAGGAGSTPGARAASSPEAEQARRAALDSLLGPEEARVFEAAERIAARAVAPRYRREWSRQLHAPEL